MTHRSHKKTWALQVLVTVATCAAVLVTSFEDEVLLASAVAANVTSAGPMPPELPDAGELFPDLSREVDEGPDGDAAWAESETFGSDRAASKRATQMLRSQLGHRTPRRVVLCVWLI